MGRTRTLDSHASRLRRKLDPESGRYVVNCWGVGYRLIDGPEEDARATIAGSAAIAWPLALDLRDGRASPSGRASAGAASGSTGPCTSCAARCRRWLCAMPAGSAPARGQLELALEALERARPRSSTGAAARRPSGRRARALAERRRRPLAPVAAARPGGRSSSAGAPSGSRVRCDPAAIARALDNLIANALEHGGGPISVEGAVRGARLRVCRRRRGRARRPRRRSDDGGGPAGATGRARSAPRPRPARGRRGRRRARRAASPPAATGAGASAVIELPLAER